MSCKAYRLAAVAMLLSSASSAVLAQNVSGSEQNSAASAASAATSSPEEPGLEDIVVTAQRKAERLQDVPIAVSAVTGAQLAARGVTAVDTLVTTVPSFQVTEIGFGFTTFLRGVGSTNSAPNAEASVATYIDGVYQASIVGNALDFNNVARVEVLKGPQGTLFGRNSTGGVIQIITRDPVQEPTMEARFGYANYDTVSASAYLSGGLTDTIAADLSVQYADQGDGWGRNVLTGEPVFKYNTWSARSKLLFTPRDGTRITLAGDYGKRNTDLITYQIEAPHVGLDGLSHRPGRFDVEVNRNSRALARSWGGSLRVEQDLGAAQFVSITSRRIAHGISINDVDTTPLSLLNATSKGRTTQWTQEVQLISQGTSRLQWQVGGFYYGGIAAYDPITVDGGLIGGSLDTFGKQRTKSYAAYGQATYNLTSTSRISGGLRFTHERQTYDGSVGTFVAAESQKFNKMTWRLALDQKLSPDLLVYASYNRGLKTGGYGLGSPTAPGFAPEILDAYEVGLKSEFLNHRVRFNVAGFYYDYQDLQVEAFPPTSTGSPVAFIQNAAKARIKGIDADVQVIPLRGLTLSAGAGYLDGEYRDFPGPAVYSPNPFVPIALANAAGKRPVRLPKFTGNAAVTYDLETDIGRLSATANVSYSSKYYFDPANLFDQRPYTLIGASVTWWDPSEHVGVTVWGKNLSDVDYISSAVGTPFGLLQSPAAPRTYGLTLSTKF